MTKSKEDEMGGACQIHGEYIQGCDTETWRDQFEDLSIDGKNVLKQTLNKKDGMAWTALIWLRIGTGGGLLWTCWWNFQFHEMRGISRVAHKPSREGLYSVELNVGGVWGGYRHFVDRMTASTYKSARCYNPEDSIRIPKRRTSCVPSGLSNLFNL
jgi:hypothetical protein